MYIFSSNGKLGGDLLHCYELILLSKYINKTFKILIPHNNKFSSLIFYFLKSFNLNVSISEKNINRNLETTHKIIYQAIGQNILNSFQDSFFTINFLINKLNYKSYNIKDNNFNFEANPIIKNILNSKNCLGISIKHQPPFDLNESNANIELWSAAINEFLKNNPNIYLFFLGNESYDLSKNLHSDQIIHPSQDLINDLMVSLKVKSMIGTASGFFTMANLSNKPYVIYKSPEHHKESIQKEVVQNKLPFCSPNQEFKFAIPSRRQLIDDLTKLSFL